MRNTEDILKRILLNMKYDPKKSLVENKISIIKESNTLCKSIEDFIKDKNSCFFLKKGEFYENPFIPSQLYSYNVDGNTLYEVVEYNRQESIKVFMGVNNLPKIESTVFIDNKTLINQLTTLFGGSGSVTPYVNLPTSGNLKYVGEFDKVNTDNITTWGNRYRADNGNGTIVFTKESATDDMIRKAVNFFNGDSNMGDKSILKNPNNDSKNSKNLDNSIETKNKTNPFSTKKGEDNGSIMFDLEL